MADNALNKALIADKERYQITQLVNRIYHSILADMIADANRREVMERLYKFYTESNLTLIDKQQLRVYQELEKLQLDSLLTKANPLLVLPKEE